MPRYQWEGMDFYGGRQYGAMEASSVEQLRQYLVDRGIALLNCKIYKRSFGFSIFLSRKHVSTDDLIIFFEHLGMLLSSGVDLGKALSSCALQTKNGYFRKAIKQMLNSVLKGASFAQAIEHSMPNFGLLIVPLIATGEQTGSLGAVCQNLALYFVKQQELKKKIKKSLLVPIITLSSALLIALLVILFVIPVFEDLFAASYASIPRSTKILIHISCCLRSQTILLFMGISGIVIFLGIQIWRDSLKKFFYTFLSHIAPIKKFLVSCELVRFFDLLSLFIVSGFPLVDSLKRVHKVMEATRMEKAVNNIIQYLEQGISFEEALRKNSKIFSSAVVALVGVGEKTGNFEFMINKTAALCDKQLGEKLTFFATVLGPSVMIILGIGITILLVVLYLPIFNIAAMPHW